MADRLEIYKGALRLLGPSNLASLTEDRPERHTLDSVWTKAGDLLLQKGLWNWAIRTVELSYDEDVEPLFGFQHAFSKPDDYIRTVSISETADFREGLRAFEPETSYWHTDPDTIYVRYISNDDAYGWNVGAWPESFAITMEAYMAYQSGLPISSDRGNRNDMYQLYKNNLKDAKSLDAVDERVREKPPGRLTRARQANGRRDLRRG